ncbi:MAG TPA: hypothetical protein VNZ44_12800, partial [Pyrinomonadaceae bacterium]|nr:hypothetical protein [Pyrinomonadaceae bacterium]
PVYGTGLGTLDAGTNNNAVVNNNSSSLTPNNAGNVGTTGWLVTGTGLYFQTPVTFATLPADGNGVMRYCSDCVHGSNPCAGGGTGAIAKRLNNQWVCN